MTKTMPACAIACALLGLLYATSSSAAEVVKCKSSSGQITYTQSACPPGTSPLDLPDTVPADTGSSSFTRSSPRTLSPRGAEMKRLSDSCIRPRSAECGQFQEMQRFCARQENWPTADCKALREANQQELEHLTELGNSFRERDEQRCREGDEKACRAACSIGMDTPPERIKTCARRLNHEVGRTWAQQGGGGKSYVGRIEGESLSIVCFAMVEFRNPVGMMVSMHPFTSVTRYQPPGSAAMGYRLDQREFSTLDEAAVAGCEQSAAKIRASGSR
jgi:hypothetical protein